ncbi:ubiquitin carboxyl-terminal hydrolase 17-like protein 6 [Cebus imitator]|uniref:ubiquitin carboxyl-terminal hydrolase 17-like protein 6 n=1 Tax=Cebus imitator TaxID=2715852 RepID=UPI000809FAEC|nr:ubiquitin carboxyl-terminal hydrolase 17-like protein 6 [Cebus imitator]
MEADSLHLKGESHDFPKLTSSRQDTAVADFKLRSLPEKSSLSSEPHVHLSDDLAPEPARQLAPRDKLSLSSRRPAAVGAGLQNVGNTCYVNASLQCLTYTPPLAKYMLSGEHSQTCHRQKCCMLCTMQAHMTQALHRPGHVIQPSQVLAAGFHRRRQEDAHEFLMFTLNAMKKTSLPGHKQLDHHSEDTTLIHQIFGGYWRSQIQCLHCHGISDTFDPYLDIALDIQAAQSVKQALEHLVKPEELNGENAYHCGICLQKVPASKTLTLHTSPKVLILVLKRFSHVTGHKLAKNVPYPECLDMQPYMSEQNSGPLLYVLYAVLVHTGWSCHNGHYFSYVKAGAGDDQWYKMDDAEVTACSMTSALNQQAYVLFYIQKTELERDSEIVSIGREPRALGAEDTHSGATQGELKRDPCLPVCDLKYHLEERATDESTLDHWKFLQEQNKTKPEFHIRNVEWTLPPNALVIHQSKYKNGMKNHHPEQQSSLLNNSGNLTDHESMHTGTLTCVKGRARRSKGKNKHSKRALLVCQ